MAQFETPIDMLHYRHITKSGAPIDGKPCSRGRGSLLLDKTTYKVYVNRGTSRRPVWEAIGWAERIATALPTFDPILDNIPRMRAAIDRRLMLMEDTPCQLSKAPG